MTLRPGNIHAQAVQHYVAPEMLTVYPLMTKRVLQRLAEDDDTFRILGLSRDDLLTGGGIDMNALEEECDGHMEELFPNPNKSLFYWPTDLTDAADTKLLSAHLWLHDLPVCLMNDDGEFFLVLTGGGMDFSWHLAGAYILCGFLPPLHILSNLAESENRGPEELRQQIIDSCEEAIDSIRGDLAQLRSTHSRLKGEEAARNAP